MTRHTGKPETSQESFHGVWISKLVYPHLETVQKNPRNELVTPTAWTNLEEFILSEGTQSHKVAYSAITLMERF